MVEIFKCKFKMQLIRSSYSFVNPGHFLSLYYVTIHNRSETDILLPVMIRDNPVEI